MSLYCLLISEISLTAQQICQSQLLFLNLVEIYINLAEIYINLDEIYRCRIDCPKIHKIMKIITEN